MRLPQRLHKYAEAGPVVAVHPVVEGGEDEVHYTEDGDEERDHEQELELVDDGYHVGEPRGQEDASQSEEEGGVSQEPVREVEEPPPEGDRAKSGESPSEKGKWQSENFFFPKLSKEKFCVRHGQQPSMLRAF